MKSFYNLCILALLAVLAPLTTHAQGAWISSDYRFLSPDTVRVDLRLDWSVAELHNTAGMSAEITFDPGLFSNPEIVSNNGVNDLMVNGLVVRPGVYRFTIYTNPISDSYKYLIDLCQIYFHAKDGLFGSDKTAHLIEVVGFFRPLWGVYR